MAKVFLLQKSRRGFDLSSAEKYGTVITVLGERESPSLAPAPALIKLRQAIREYNPDTDFFLSAGGDPLAALMIGMLLVDEGKSASWLRWDRNRDFDGRRDMTAGEYKPVRFDLNGPVKSLWGDDD